MISKSGPKIFSWTICQMIRDYFRMKINDKVQTVEGGAAGGGGGEACALM